MIKGVVNLGSPIINNSIKVVVIILVIAIIVVTCISGPFVTVRKQTHLVKVVPPIINMLDNGASDAAIENAVKRSGDNVDQITSLGGTLLYFAVRHRRRSLVKWLLEKQHARPNGQLGSDPLSEAIRLNDSEMVRLLLRNGADPMYEISLGMTPMWVAQNSKTKPEIMAMLQKWKARRSSSTQKAKAATRP